MERVEKIIRVFPRRTKATPDDPMAFVGPPPLDCFRPPASEVDRIDVSVTFTWDIVRGKNLLREWGQYYRRVPVMIGGPAIDIKPPGEFTPGRYVKHGMVITSRGCPRTCDHCLVPEREGNILELDVKDGWNVIDNNLLACSRPHITRVVEMLKRQTRGAEFTGGVDARLVSDWWVETVTGMNVRSMFLAYDRPEDRGHVCRVISIFRYKGVGRRRLGCYVLCGYEGDTPKAAEVRCMDVWGWGAVPFAMYYRPNSERRQAKPPEWATFVRLWTRRQEIYSRMGGDA